MILTIKLVMCSHFRGGIMTANPASYNDSALTVTMDITTYFAYCFLLTLLINKIIRILINLLTKDGAVIIVLAVTVIRLQ